MSRRITWHTKHCPICSREFQYRAGSMPGTCGRKPCIHAAQVASLRKAIQASVRRRREPSYPVQNNQRPVSEEVLRRQGPNLHHCGEPLLFGTDGLGYTTEWCGRCGTNEYTQRRVA